MSIRTSSVIGALLLAGALVACGGGGSAELRVGDAWMREPAGDSAAVYFTIDNATDRADRLVEASSDAAREVGLHRTDTEGGRSIMRPVESIEVPARGTVTLAPGGLHVMLTGLTRRPKAGDAVELHLRFAVAGERTVRVEVRPLVENEGGGMDHGGVGGGMDHGGG